MTNRPLYFDYMATTPVDPRVLVQMNRYLNASGDFGNPASRHAYGQAAAVAIEHARAQIAALVGASVGEIMFTSGATESIIIALLGAARFYQRKGNHLITLNTEHTAVLDAFRHLEREGFEVTYLTPKADGLLDLDDLVTALRVDTTLVSIMHVNNEIGVIQDIHAIGQLLRDKGIVFHVDAAQSAGKLSINLNTLPVDLMSFSAHKVYGPKGIGALYVRQKPRIRLQPLYCSGGSEGGLRSGTLATHQIVGMGEAFAIAHREGDAEQARMVELHNQFWAGIQHLPGIALNGSVVHRIPGNLNVRFDGIKNSALLIALNGLAFSTASACVAAKSQPSYVLRALGLSMAAAQSSLRLSLGRFTTADDVKDAIAIFCREIPKLLNSCLE